MTKAIALSVDETLQKILDKLENIPGKLTMSSSQSPDFRKSPSVRERMKEQFRRTIEGHFNKKYNFP